jgi:hypothetical protein
MRKAARLHPYVALAVLLVASNLPLPGANGWSWDTENGLVCPNGHALALWNAEPLGPNTLRVRLRASLSACRGCPLRDQCTTSTSPRFRKEVEFTLNRKSYSNFDSFLDAVPRKPSAQNVTTTQPARSPLLLRMLDPLLPPGPCRPIWPRLIPSVFRHAHQRINAVTVVDVRVTNLRSATALRKSRWLAVDAADRQHRRRSWEDRDRQHRLPLNAVVHARFQITDAKIYGTLRNALN